MKISVIRSIISIICLIVINTLHLTKQSKNNIKNNIKSNNTTTNKTRVLHIGLDGFTVCNKNNHKIFKSNLINTLKSQGSWTNSQLSIITGASLHGWCEQLCGMDSVSLGLTTQSLWKPSFISDDISIDKNLTSIYDNKPYNCIFSQIKKNNKNLKTYLLNSLFRINSLVDKYIFPESIDYSYYNGFNSSSYHSYDVAVDINNKTDEILTKNDFDYMFVYNTDADGFGHFSPKGFCSNEYIEHIDKFLFKVEKWIDILKQRDMWKDTVLILSSDHGSEKAGHILGDIEIATDNSYKNPFYIMGKGIKKNHEIKATNFRQYDVPIIVSRLLGISSSEEWMGKDIDEIYE